MVLIAKMCIYGSIWGGSPVPLCEFHFPCGCDGAGSMQYHSYIITRNEEPDLLVTMYTYGSYPSYPVYVPHELVCQDPVVRPRLVVRDPDTQDVLQSVNPIGGGRSPSTANGRSTVSNGWTPFNGLTLDSR